MQLNKFENKSFFPQFKISVYYTVYKLLLIMRNVGDFLRKFSVMSNVLTLSILWNIFSRTL